MSFMVRWLAVGWDQPEVRTLIVGEGLCGSADRFWLGAFECVGCVELRPVLLEFS